MTKEEQALLQKWRDNRGISMEDFEDAMNALQEPCDDTVSIRKDILKCRVGNIVAYNVEWLKKHWQMEMNIVCGVKPCDDAISRQAALNSLIDNTHLDGYDLAEALDAIENKEKLPSVTQKSGKWIEHPEIKTSTPEYLMFYECSECGDKQCFCKSDIHKKHFCNNCGAKMESEVNNG